MLSRVRNWWQSLPTHLPRKYLKKTKKLFFSNIQIFDICSRYLWNRFAPSGSLHDRILYSSSKSLGTLRLFNFLLQLMLSSEHLSLSAAVLICSFLRPWLQCKAARTQVDSRVSCQLSFAHARFLLFASFGNALDFASLLFVFLPSAGRCWRNVHNAHVWNCWTEVDMWLKMRRLSPPPECE